MSLPVEPIRQHLRRDGYAIVPGPLGGDAYDAIAHSLGTVLLRTDVALDARRSTYLCGSAPVPFHTDHPSARIVGWLCEYQDDDDGASLLIDTRRILDTYDPITIDALKTVLLPCPNLLETTTPSTRGTHPVIERIHGEVAVYYSHWLRPVQGSIAGKRAWEALFDLIHADGIASIEIRLRPGDALFVDNRRMLHGRRALREGSRRRLRRVWIESDLKTSSR